MVERPLRVAVTGATGLLGGRLVARLLTHAGAEVLALARPGGRVLGEHPHLHRARVGLTDEGRLVQLLLGFRPDAVVHCAASGLDYAHGDWVSVIDTNVGGTVRLLRATSIAGAHFVYVSTGLVYRDQGRALREEDPLESGLAYGASKAAADLLLRAGAAELQTPVTVLRPFSFTGPGDRDGRLFTAILDASAAGRRVPLTSGAQRRDYCHVDDVADGVLAALGRPPAPGSPPRVLNLGSGEPRPVRALVESVVAALGLEVELGFGDRPTAAEEPGHLVADVGAAARILGWTAHRSVAHAVWELARDRHPSLQLTEPNPARTSETP